MSLSSVAVIDVGSNSVRYASVENGKILSVKSNTCQLALGKIDGYLNVLSMNRTCDVIKEFTQEARERGQKILAFATAAVRNSINGGDFCQMVQSRTGVILDVLSEEREALVALSGALGDKDGLVVDIGGASSEIIVRYDGRISYIYSLDYGAVNLRDKSNNSFSLAREIMQREVARYGEVPSSHAHYAVGGTATSASACIQNLVEYDATKTHLSKITKEDLSKLSALIESMPASEFIKGRSINLKRAQVLPYGIIILQNVMNVCKIDEITVSESDNLQGYLNLFKGNL